MPVSVVDWEEFSKSTAAVVVVSTDEAVWDESRGVEEEATLLRASFLSAAARLASFAAGKAAAGELLLLLLGLVLVVVAHPVADGAVLLESAGRELLADDVDNEREDALLEKTFWGFCLIFVK
jgi:hypothetical protein